MFDKLDRLKALTWLLRHAPPSYVCNVRQNPGLKSYLQPSDEIPFGYLKRLSVMTPIEAEHELVEVGLQVLAAQAVVDAERPAFEVGEEAMCPGQQRARPSVRRRAGGE